MALQPGKVYFPKPGWTKLDLAEYYVGMADAVLVHVRERLTVMKRFVNGIMEDPIWQKRVPQKVPAGPRPPPSRSRPGALPRSSWQTTPPTSSGRSTSA